MSGEKTGATMGVTTSRLHPDQRNELVSFLAAVRSIDGETALSEYKEMRLDGRFDSRERVALTDDGSLIGYGQAAWHKGAEDEGGHWAFEIAVHPEHRSGHVTAELIESLREEAGDVELTLWARAPYVGSAARSAGWRLQRQLMEMRRPLPMDCAEIKDGSVSVTTFRVGLDEPAWLAANNAAFAGHPENGRMTRRDLEERIAQPWFDPDGFFLAWSGDDLVGSCWTKIHDDGVGEIYIIGVVPSWGGQGLGTGLVCHGLNYLGRMRHLSSAMLFVSADNERAVRVYESLGFERTRVIEAFSYRSGT